MITELPFYLQALILFISQIGFIYFRTRNVKYNADLNRIGVLWSGAFVHVFWLISIAIGVTAIIKGNYILILFSWAGGAIGADWALKTHKK